MRKPSNFLRTMRRAAWPAIGLTIIAFFGAYAILGRNGVLAYGDYKRQLVKREKEFAALDRQRAVLVDIYLSFVGEDETAPETTPRPPRTPRIPAAAPRIPAAAPRRRPSPSTPAAATPELNENEKEN